MKNDYVPISCAFYDELEAAAVKKTNSTIVYKENFEEKIVVDFIIDFKTKDKQEFVLLKNGTQIRLDKIISFNDLKPSDKDYC